MKMMKHTTAEFEHENPVRGTVPIAVDIDSPEHPYDALAFLPGHAPASTDFSRVVIANPSEPEPNFHLKDPRPRG